MLLYPVDILARIELARARCMARYQLARADQLANPLDSIAGRWAVNAFTRERYWVKGIRPTKRARIAHATARARAMAWDKALDRLAVMAWAIEYPGVCEDCAGEDGHHTEDCRRLPRDPVTYAPVKLWEIARDLLA